MSEAQSEEEREEEQSEQEQGLAMGREKREIKPN